MSEYRKRVKALAQKRADEMRAMRDKGATLHQIGLAYGISRQRVHQIITKEFAA